MSLFAMDRRGLFNGIRVPGLDVSAVIVGFIGLVVYRLGLSAIALIAGSAIPTDMQTGGSASILNVMIGNIFSVLGSTGTLLSEVVSIPARYQELPLGLIIVVSLWTALVWSFLAGALMRIAAINIARDDSISPGEAIRHGFSLLLTNFFTILALCFVLVMIYFVTNSLILGSIASVPYLGDFLLIPFYLLTVISSLMMIMVLTLGTTGIHLSAAAVATELTDGYGGISRAWSYLLARFWTYVLTTVLSLIVLVIILTAGQLFLKMTVSSFSTKNVGLGNSPILYSAGPLAQEMMKNAPQSSGKNVRDYSMENLTLPGKGTYLFNRVVGQRPAHTGAYVPSAKSSEKTELSYVRVYLQAQANGQIVDVLPAVKQQSFFYYAVEGIYYLFTVLKYLVYAFALFYFFASQTAVYFLLRYEVDGDQFNEISNGDEDDNSLFTSPSYPSDDGSFGGGPKPEGKPKGDGPSAGGDDKGKRSLPMVMEV